MPWPKGKSGNPAGAGAPRRLVKELKEFLSQPTEIRGQNKDRIELLLESLYTYAVKGNGWAQKMIWAYHEGMPTQRIELAGSISAGAPVDMSKATTEELKQLEAILMRVRSRQGDDAST